MNAYSKPVVALLFAALCSTASHAQDAVPAQAEDNCTASDSIFKATALRYIEFAVDKKNEILNRPLSGENVGLEEFVSDLGIFAGMSPKIDDARELGTEVMRGIGILHDAEAFMEKRFTRAENDSLINELRRLCKSTRLNASQKKELDDKAVELEYTELAIYDLYDIHTEVSKIINDPVYAPGSESALLEDIDALIESLKDKTDNIGKYPYLESVLDAYLKAIHSNPRAIDPQIVSLIERLNGQYTDNDETEKEEMPAEPQAADDVTETAEEAVPTATVVAEEDKANESGSEAEIIEDVIDEPISEVVPATPQPSSTKDTVGQPESDNDTDKDNIIDTRYTD